MAYDAYGLHTRLSFRPEQGNGGARFHKPLYSHPCTTGLTSGTKFLIVRGQPDNISTIEMFLYKIAFLMRWTDNIWKVKYN